MQPSLAMRQPAGLRPGSSGSSVAARRAPVFAPHTHSAALRSLAPAPRRPAGRPLPHPPASAAGDASAAFPPGWGPRPEGAASGGASSGSGSSEQQQLSLLQRVKRFFLGDGLDKERLKALGMGAFASYGAISNVNYGFALGMAWLAFVKRYGVAPTAAGQWPAFLAFYAGFWAVQNFARPLRLSLAIALAPAFDRGISLIGEKLNVKKGVAFGIYLFGMAIFTSTALFGSLYLLGGFPAAK